MEQICKSCHGIKPPFLTYLKKRENNNMSAIYTCKDCKDKYRESHEHKALKKMSKFAMSMFTILFIIVAFIIVPIFIHTSFSLLIVGICAVVILGLYYFLLIYYEWKIGSYEIWERANKQ